MAARRPAKARSITDEAGSRSARSPAAASARQLDAPIAMGYVDAAHAAEGTRCRIDGPRRAAPGPRRADAVCSHPLLPRPDRSLAMSSIALHQGPRMGPPGRRYRRDRHHRLRPVAARRRRLCRAAGSRPQRSSRARRPRSSNWSRRRARSTPRCRARSSRSTRRSSATRPRSTPTRWARAGSSRCGWPTPQQLDGLMDEAAYQAFVAEQHVMRYLPLTDADRRDMLAAIGVGVDRRLFADVPAAARHDGPLDLPLAMGELEVERAARRDGGEEYQRRLGAVFPRRRRLSPSRAGRGRSPDPARRVPDLATRPISPKSRRARCNTCSNSRPRSRC